jgi:hypothetical protein
MPFPILPNQKTKKTPKSPMQPVNLDMLNYQGGGISGQVFEDVSQVNVGDREAAMVYDIWLNKDEDLSNANSHLGEEEDIYNIPDKLSYQDVLSLKSRGLIEGGDKTVKFTPKAKEVIKNMILFGEDSSFEQKKSVPKYSDVRKKIQENMQKKSNKRIS